LASAEKKLIEEGKINEEQVQKLCDVPASIFGGSVEEINGGQTIE
jgi:DUF438 domain-containing protein